MKWQVTGMTCRSCEKLVSDVLKDVTGVLDVEVSLKMSKAAARLRDEAKDPDLDLLNRQLEAHGYRLYPEGCRLPSSAVSLITRLRRAILALLLVGVVGYLFWLPLHGVLPSIKDGASVGALFLLGLVASLSSCLAMTGGFMLAYSAETGSRRKTILMHIGRLAAFILGGAALGALGGVLPSVSSAWYAILALLFGVGFFGVALSLMDLAPSWSKLGLALPPSFRRFADRVKRRPGGLAPFLVGAVTFVLPCGFTQTAQVLAVSSGSATQGLLYMFAFALGTLPVLLGVTAYAAKVSLKQGLLRLMIGAVMFFFAIGQLESGLSLFGVALDYGFGQHFSDTGLDAKVTGISEQLLTMKVTPNGYEPPSLTVRKDIPVRWEVDGTDAGGCTGGLVSRELGIDKALHPGLNIFSFTPHRTGLIAFSCSMGMVRGAIRVID